MSISKRLAEFVATAAYSDLSDSVVADTKRAVLDWLGSALSGALEQPARMVQGISKRFGLSDEATLFGAGRSSAAAAALANGVASHILELDDIHKTSTVHAAAAIVPAALAAAERQHADGRAFLLSVALGYEAALRVGEAVNPSHYRYWHPTGTVATFGAAAAAGSLIGLTSAQMLDAFGSAGTQAAGLWEFNADGAMSKHLHPGKAALNGLLAADLAQVGFTGASHILEGERGFFRAMSESFDPSCVTAGLGENWKISENCYKLHSCCGHTHSAIDVALQAGAIAPEEIRQIRIETYGPGYEIVKDRRPSTPYQAKFSIAYCVATALIHGRAGLDEFSSEKVLHPATQALMDRTEVVVAEDLTAKYPAAWPVRLTLTTADGKTVQRSADYPRGNPENPVSTAELEQKFLGLTIPRISHSAAHRALAAVQSLETCSDMALLFRSLA